MSHVLRRSSLLLFSTRAATEKLTLPRLFPRWKSNTTNQPPKKKMEELKKNPFFDKYADRLNELKEKNPEKFLQKAEEIKARNAAEAASTNPSAADAVNPVQAAAAKSAKARPVYNKQRELKDVMKTDLLDGRSAKEIAEIWTSYHKGKEGHISGVVPAAMYDSIVERANQFPIFLYPLPRAGGYEFFVAEFQARECYFTQLISYQTRQADSPPCLSVIHFEDCKKDGIVLMRGEFDHKILNPAEVQCLLNQMQLYYGTEDNEKKRLLESFNKHPDTFKHMDLISEVEHSFAALKS